MWKYILLPLTLGIVLFLQAACAPKYKSEEDCGFVQNIYGERISWKRLPIQIWVHDSFPSEQMDSLKEAFQAWSTSFGGREVFKFMGYIHGPLDPKYDGASTIYMLDEWEADKSSEQGRTSVYWEGNLVKDADIRLNNKDFSFYSKGMGRAGEVHLTSLLVHELGHVLGLRHNEDHASVMQTYLASREDRSKVNEIDVRNLKCEY